MREWTEQEEQEMIERAKAGDPEANYELSLWALRRSEEEPEESRWNRLAAKCLVKAAQAGYGPAKERMDSLLKQSAAQKEASLKQEEIDEPPAPVKLSEARQAAARQRARQSTARRPASESRARRGEDPENGYGPSAWDGDDEDEYEDDAPARGSGRKFGGGPLSFFSQWTESQWRTMELVCVAICVVLLAAILVMVFTGRNNESSPSGTSVPPPSEAETAETEPTPEPEQYPDDDTRAAIMAADLQVFPMDENYEAVPTTGTVSVNGTSLRLRKGPNTSYEQTELSDGSKAEMSNGTVVDVYARKDGFALVGYNDNGTTVYGWCSADYLVLSAGNSIG